MRNILVSIAMAAMLASPAIAQAPQPQVTPTEHIKLDLSMQELQTIGNALGKLPYENVAPILQNLSKQLNDYTEAKKAAEKTAEPLKDDRK